MRTLLTMSRPLARGGPLSLSRPLVGSWTPVQLGAQMAAWFDPTIASTITLNGSTIAQIDDISGNGRHAAQGSGASQPTYTANQTLFSNLPSMTWPNASNSRSLVTPTFAAQEWYFIVAFANGVRSTWYITSQGLFSSSNNVAVTVIGLNAAVTAATSLWYTVNQFNTIRTNGAASTVDANAGTTAIPMPAIILQAQRAGGALTPNAGWMIGGDRNFANRGWSGPYGEIVACATALGTSDREMEL